MSYSKIWKRKFQKARKRIMGISRQRKEEETRPAGGQQEEPSVSNGRALFHKFHEPF